MKYAVMSFQKLPEPTAMPRNAPEIPRVALELPPDSGLVLVETTHAASTTAEERAKRWEQMRAQK